ncbi:sentrin-specific protease 1-like [Haliotis rufescens]|uniref:sentrin-specific protease 1-like n=1 Tax=Haliotis rufescens TaxID=6454 RepID=UPI00201E846A|nr:sentrin-specific protease 1-like [Haliotis rufescens]
MFSSVSDKIKSFIFQPSHEEPNLSVSRKRKRIADETDGQDSDIEIVEVKRPKKESTGSSFWTYLKLPVNKMAQWVRQRGSGNFSSDFGVRELPENSRWRQRPHHQEQHPAVRPTVKVPTTNGGSVHTQIHGRPPIHTEVAASTCSTSMNETPRVNGEQSVHHQEVQTDQLSRSSRRRQVTPTVPRSRGLFTAQESVRLDEKKRYRELLQTFAPSVRLDEENRDKTADASSAKLKIPSTFDFGGNNSILGHSFLGNNSVFASELKAKTPTPRPAISSTLLTTRRKNALEVFQSTPLSRTGKEQRNMSKLRVHQQSVVIPDDKNDEISERISPILDRTSHEFQTSPYASEGWVEDLKSRYSAEARERRRKITEAEIIAKVHEERRKERDENLEKMIKERMRLEDKEPPVLEELPPLEPEKEERLPDITSDMENIIAGAKKGFPPDQVLVEGYRLQITRKDMATLDGLNWLNDEIINFYMNMLIERGGQEDRPKVYAFNTFFYSKLMNGGHSAVRRWTRKIDIFSHDYLLVPVHLGVHWCMAVIDIKKKKVSYFDSMGGKNVQCLQGLKKYLADESLDKKKQAFDFTGWEFQIESDIPQQMNGSDCGMFACKFAEYITREAPISFTQEHMPYFRKRMVYEILKKKLLQ